MSNFYVPEGYDAFLKGVYQGLKGKKTCKIAALKWLYEKGVYSEEKVKAELRNMTPFDHAEYAIMKLYKKGGAKYSV